MKRMRPHPWRALAAALVAGLGVGVAGCGAKPCSSPDPSRAVSAVECPSGHLCYQGECKKTCNAGAERATECESDDECTAAARPQCVAGFCSTCDEGSLCVPSLNICESIVAAENDGGSVDASDDPRANPPRDGGFIDGSVFNRDTGTRQMEDDKPPTHYATIDIAQIDTYRDGRITRTASISVEAVAINDGMYVGNATVARAGQGLFRCEVRRNAQFTGSSSVADIGVFTFQNPRTSGGLRPSNARYEARFVNGAYQVTPTPPVNLFTFSSTQPPSFTSLELIGRGNRALNIGAFPPPDQDSFHVPHQLFPGRNRDDDTPALLQSGITVQNPARKLVFLWKHPSPFPGVNIILRVEGPSHHIRCSADDRSERLEVVARILQTYRDLNQIPPNTTLPLHFEREHGQRLGVPTTSPDIRVQLELKIRHTLTSWITFQ